MYCPVRGMVHIRSPHANWQNKAMRWRREFLLLLSDMFLIMSLTTRQVTVNKEWLKHHLNKTFVSILFHLCYRHSLSSVFFMTK